MVARFDEKLIRAALELELERGGQVYFVHNRVETIYEISARIQELVPHARVTVGHGQMSEGELERVMLAFMHGEYDVLVATTIIENGLDIPLANTILISRADRHGLSELYQLRGRVGRSNRRAYAYLLIPPEHELTEIARGGLAALKEFSDLGAGFKITPHWIWSCAAQAICWVGSRAVTLRPWVLKCTPACWNTRSMS